MNQQKNTLYPSEVHSPMEVEVKIYRPSPKGPVLADASVTLNGCFAIRGIQIREGKNGPFVSMPSRPVTIVLRTMPPMPAHSDTSCSTVCSRPLRQNIALPCERLFAVFALASILEYILPIKRGSRKLGCSIRTALQGSLAKSQP